MNSIGIFQSFSSSSSLPSSSSQPPSASKPSASLTSGSVGINPVAFRSSSLSSLSSTSSLSSSSSQPPIESENPDIIDPCLKDVFDALQNCSVNRAKIIDTNHIKAIFNARKVFSINIGNTNNYGFGYQVTLMKNLFYKAHKLSGGGNPDVLRAALQHCVVETLKAGGEDSPWQAYRNLTLVSPSWGNISFSLVWSPSINSVLIGVIEETTNHFSDGLAFDYRFSERLRWTHDQGILLTQERVREIFNSWGGLKHIGLNLSLPGDAWRTYESPSPTTLEKENDALKKEKVPEASKCILS